MPGPDFAREEGGGGDSTDGKMEEGGYKRPLRVEKRACRAGMVSTPVSVV